jgi:DNA helicase-2/ATP-dependent DNA helicase PcrA
MDALDAIEPAAITDLPPLFAGLQPVPTSHSLWGRLVRAVDERRLPARAIAALTGFRDLLVQLTGMAAEESISIALGKMLDQSGYLADLREERSEDAEGRIENLLELVSAAREYETRTPEPSLAGFVDQLSLLSDVDEEAGARNARVLMMTLHSAKGLEFPQVYLVGMEEGLLPHHKSIENDGAGIDEERRLCYVGVTRARDRLTISLALSRMKWGKPRTTDPSRFLFELTGQADNPRGNDAHSSKSPNRPRRAVVGKTGPPARKPLSSKPGGPANHPRPSRPAK